jgi:PHD/YefM family antitoxin component YafN of YafNO toxin-antitoxin module
MSPELAYTYGEVNDMYATTLNNAQRDLENFVNLALTQDEVITLATDKGNVIMISEFEYRSLRETLNIYANPEVAGELRRRIAEANAGINMSEHPLIEVSNEDIVE